MRATSAKRRASKPSRAMPGLVPVKNQERSAWFGQVIPVELHPDHYLTADKAEQYGLVTVAMIARAFGTQPGTVAHWAQSASFPDRKAYLMADGKHIGRPHLYDKREVIAWVARVKPKYIEQARRTA